MFTLKSLGRIIDDEPEVPVVTDELAVFVRLDKKILPTWRLNGRPEKSMLLRRTEEGLLLTMLPGESIEIEGDGRKVTVTISSSWEFRIG